MINDSHDQIDDQYYACKSLSWPNLLYPIIACEKQLRECKLGMQTNRDLHVATSLVTFSQLQKT